MVLLYFDWALYFWAKICAQVWDLKGQRVVGAMLLNSSEMTDPVREIIRCKYCSSKAVLKSITEAVVKQ